jgi:hypothetical protein
VAAATRFKMVSDAFGFLLRNKFVVLFYLAVVMFVFLRRKRFEFHLKVIALYKTGIGIKLMDRLASKYRELIKLFGYISIGIGFAGMLFIIFVLVQSVYTRFSLFLMRRLPLPRYSLEFTFQAFLKAFLFLLCRG